MKVFTKISFSFKMTLKMELMKTRTFLIFLTLVFLVSCTTNNTKQRPPLAPVKPVEDVYFGKKISDPYRYMENLQDSSVQKWFKAQSDYSRKILNSIPGRQKLIAKMKEFDGRKSAQISLLNITDNDRYFYLKRAPADETGKLFYRDGFKGEEHLLFDPKTYSTDTTKKSVISSISPSLDGNKVAFNIAPNGSENGDILIIDVKTQKIFPERIDRCWFETASWLPDGKSFFYNRLQSSDVHQKNREFDSKVFLHSIDTDPATDKEIFSRAKYPKFGIKPEDIPYVIFDNDSKFLFCYISTVDNRMNVYYVPSSDLAKEKIVWKHLFKPEDEVYSFATSNKELYIFTPKGAPNYKILKTSLINPDLNKAEIAVPEDHNRAIISFGLTSDGLYYSLSENGVAEKLFFLPQKTKTAKEIKLPFPAGSIGLSIKGFKYSDIWITIMGWTSDIQRYRYSAQKNEFTIENLSSTAEYPEYVDLIVEELMIPSHDGIKVPLSLVYKKGILKNGKNPVLILGYGAYGISENPFFSPGRLLWTYNDGIFAIAHVRGGGELGDKWYKGGYKTTKPNTWKDLIACAEYLVNEKYTSPKNIAINGGSAGGILIGRAMTERPDLFAAAIPQVGWLNELRTEESPNGPVNAAEFGTVKDSVECMALIEMDSFHHIIDGVKYPATLITAGMNDPRVIAWEPAKFAARLQAANASDKPILFWTDYAAGHGMGNTKTKSFESLADVLSFAFWQTGHPDYQLK
jgi:prolyl oligopeptidase